MWCCCSSTPSLIFFTTDTPTTQIYTLSLHDALPISEVALQLGVFDPRMEHRCQQAGERPGDDVQVTKTQVGFIQLAIVELVADDPPGGLFDAVGRRLRERAGGSFNGISEHHDRGLPALRPRPLVSEALFADGLAAQQRLVVEV